MFWLAFMKSLTNSENPPSNPLQEACYSFQVAACKSCFGICLWFWKLFRKPAITCTNRAGILEQSMGARTRVRIGLSYWPARLHSLPGFNSLKIGTVSRDNRSPIARTAGSEILMRLSEQSLKLVSVFKEASKQKEACTESNDLI